jgi:hypothetical protein
MQLVHTLYADHIFRTRLEARWAYLFDRLGIRWEYHPQGFALDDGRYYLPSFYLHFSGGVYAEVQSENSDFAKSELFAKHRRVVLLAGAPRPVQYRLLQPMPKLQGEEREVVEWPVCFHSKYLSGKNKHKNQFFYEPEGVEGEEFIEEFAAARRRSFDLDDMFFDEFE